MWGRMLTIQENHTHALEELEALHRVHGHALVSVFDGAQHELDTLRRLSRDSSS